MIIDWPPSMTKQAGPMEFGPWVSGTERVFPEAGHGVYLPYYPCLIAVWVPDTGESALVGIPPGAAPTHLVAPASGLFSTVKNKGMSVNIYKEGTDLVFQFKIDVPGLQALRIM